MIQFNGTTQYMTGSGTINSVRALVYMMKPVANNGWALNLASGKYVVNGAVPIGLTNAAVYVDNVAKTLLGSEVVANPTFNSGLTNWSQFGSGVQSNPAQDYKFTWDNTGNGGGAGLATLSAGRWRITVNVKENNTVDGKLNIGLAKIGGQFTTKQVTGTGIKEVVVNWTSPQDRVTIYGPTATNTIGNYFVIDDVSAKLIQTPLTAGAWNHVIITADAFTINSFETGRADGNFGAFDYAYQAILTSLPDATTRTLWYNSGVPLGPSLLWPNLASGTIFWPGAFETFGITPLAWTKVNSPTEAAMPADLNVIWGHKSLLRA